MSTLRRLPRTGSRSFGSTTSSGTGSSKSLNRTMGSDQVINRSFKLKPKMEEKPLFTQQLLKSAEQGKGKPGSRNVSTRKRRNREDLEKFKRAVKHSQPKLSPPPTDGSVVSDMSGKSTDSCNASSTLKNESSLRKNVSGRKRTRNRQDLQVFKNAIANSTSSLRRKPSQKEKSIFLRKKDKEESISGEKSLKSSFIRRKKDKKKGADFKFTFWENMEDEDTKPESGKSVATNQSQATSGRKQLMASDREINHSHVPSKSPSRVNQDQMDIKDPLTLHHAVLSSKLAPGIDAPKAPAKGSSRSMLRRLRKKSKTAPQFANKSLNRRFQQKMENEQQSDLDLKRQAYLQYRKKTKDRTRQTTMGSSGTARTFGKSKSQVSVMAESPLQDLSSRSRTKRFSEIDDEEEQMLEDLNLLKDFYKKKLSASKESTASSSPEDALATPLSQFRLNSSESNAKQPKADSEEKKALNPPAMESFRLPSKKKTSITGGLRGKISRLLRSKSGSVPRVPNNVGDVEP